MPVCVCRWIMQQLNKPVESDHETSISPHLIRTASARNRSNRPLRHHSTCALTSSPASHGASSPHTPPLLLPLRPLQRIPNSKSATRSPNHRLFSKTRREQNRKNQNILSKSPGQRLLRRNLLTPHKRIHSNSNSAIDIVTTAIIRKPHLAK